MKLEKLTFQGSYLLASAAFVLFYFLARVLLKAGELDTALRVVVALLPAPFFVWFIWSLGKLSRTVDEREKRIQLEAFAFAFPLTMVLLFTLGLLELAMELPKEDLSYRHVWAMLPAFYFLGLALAKRRYQ